MVVNRIGDLGLALGMFTLIVSCGALDFDTIFSLTPLMANDYILLGNFSVHTLSLVGIFLFIGAVGKSAQFGLHT